MARLTTLLSCLCLLASVSVGSCSSPPRAQGEPRRAAAPEGAPAAPSTAAAPHQATAAPTEPVAVPAAAPEEPADAPVPVPVDSFLGEPDDPRLSSLRSQEIASVERGSGGRSLGFKIRLADGTKGYYKPEQTFSAAHWYGEVAAYHLDRELGLGRSIPTVSRSFAWRPVLQRQATGDVRESEIIVQRDGTVRGAFVWWVDGGLSPLRLREGWEQWIRFDKKLSPEWTPYQRAGNFRRDDETADAASTAPQTAAATPAPAAPAVAAPADAAPARRSGRAPTPDIADRPAELSDMILFDYLTHNLDRWGGDNTNVRTRGDHGPLTYLDNAAGFSIHVGRTNMMDLRLKALHKFRRSTVDAIRRFDIAKYKARLDREALAPILNEEQLNNLELRRRYLLEYVDSMVAKYGDRAYAW